MRNGNILSMILGKNDLLIIGAIDWQDHHALFILQLPDLRMEKKIKGFTTFLDDIIFYDTDQRRLIVTSNVSSPNKHSMNAVTILDFGDSNLGRETFSHVFDPLPV